MIVFVHPSIGDWKKFVSYNLCLLAFAFNLIFYLNAYRFDVIYNMERSETEITKMSVCMKIKWHNCSTASEKNSEKCNQLNELFNYTMDDSVLSKSPNSIAAKAREANLSDWFILEPEYSNLTFFLHNKHLCLGYTLAEENYILFHLHNKYSLSIFVFLQIIDFSLDRHVFNYECKDFQNCEGFVLNRLQVVVLYLETPYTSDCANYSKLKFNFTDLETVDSRVFCFNECLKDQYRFEILFYGEIDTRPYRFNTSDLFEKIGTKEESFSVFTAYCKSLCRRRNCKYIRYMDLGFARDHVDNRLLIDVEEFKVDLIGQPRLNAFQYWLQFGGLISCLFGISIFSSIENIFWLTSQRLATGSKTLRLIYSAKNVLCLTLVLLVIGNFGSISNLYEPVVENVEHERNYSYPLYKVYFCFFTTKMYKDSRYAHMINYTLDEKEYGRNLFKEHTLNHLFERMKGFEEVFVNVRANTNESSNSTENHIFKWNPEQTLLHRTSLCFELLLNFTDRRHFLFIFNTSSNKVYLMKKTMLLTLRTRRYFDDQVKESLIIVRTGSQARCKDYRNYDQNGPYREDGDLPFECKSKQNCIDRCLLNYYVRHHGKLPITLLFKKDLPQYGNYSFTSYRQAANEFCRMKFAENDCNHTIIIRDSKEVPLDPPNQYRWNISLFDREKDSREITEKEMDKIYLDIFTIYTILLGITIPSLTFLAARVYKFKSNQNYKRFKVVSFVYFTICFTGYSFLISNEVLYKVHQFMYYHDSFLKDDQMVINLCVEHGLDTKEIRTGAELEMLTKNISLETMIDHINYLDLNYSDYRTLKPGDDRTNHSKIGFEEPVFYRREGKELKCVLILFKLDTTDLSLIFVERILGIKVKPEVGKFIFFVNSNYSIFNHTKLETVYSNFSYLVNLDRYELHRDKIVRDHIERNSDYFLEEFYKHFERTTTLLPLTKERFHHTIDNALFDVYVNRSDLVKRLEYTVVYEAKMNLVNSEYTLFFGKNVFKQIHRIMNKKSLPSLVIDIFNACSLWLALSCFDLVYLLLVVVERIVLYFVGKSKTKIVIINNDLYAELCAQRSESILRASGTSLSCADGSLQFKGIVVQDA